MKKQNNGAVVSHEDFYDLKTHYSQRLGKTDKHRVGGKFRANVSIAGSSNPRKNVRYVQNDDLFLAS